MATKLDKEIVRESSIKVDGREIIVSLTENQEIKMKLKGMKSGEVKISIEDLYNQLTGRDGDDEGVNPDDEGVKSNSLVIVREDDDEDEKQDKNAPMINLYDLRSMNAISGLDVTTMSKFDGLIAGLIEHVKDIKAAQKVSQTKATGTKKKKK